MSDNATSKERQVRLFRKGRNQTVCIPREFEFDGDEVIMRRNGDQLILKPVISSNLLDVLRALGPLEEPFPEIEKFQVQIDEPDLGP